MKKIKIDISFEKGLVVLVVLISSLSILGWIMGELFLTQISSSYIPIAPATAVSFLILSLIMLFSINGPFRYFKVILNILIFLLIAFSGLIVSKWIFNLSIDIEAIFISNPESFGDVKTGRMSPLTAVIFLVETITLLFIYPFGVKLKSNYIWVLIFLSIFTSSTLLLGYLYNEPLLYGGSIIPVALPTAICFFLIGFSQAHYFHNTFSPIPLLSSTPTTARLAKAFFPVFILLIVLDGSFHSVMELFSTNDTFNTILQLVIVIPIVGSIIILIARSIGKKVEKAEKELKENEQQLLGAKLSVVQNAEKLDLALQGAGAGLWSWNIKTGEDILDERWCAILGYKQEEIEQVVSSWERLIHPDEKEHIFEVVNKHFEDESNEYNDEYRMKCKNGDWKWIHAIGRIVKRDKNGEPEIMTGIIIDIDAKKDTEAHLKALNQQLQASEHQLRAANQQLQASEQQLSASNQQLQANEQQLISAKVTAEENDRLKSAFLANMSHEIRTPMNGILGFTSLLKNVNLTGNKHEKYIGVIEQSGQRMLNTINDIIDISRIESGEVKVNIKPTNINTQLENLYDFFNIEAKKNNIVLNYKESLGNQLATIETDPEKFDAIFINLIKNALKFTPKGSIDFGYRLEDKEIHCYVKDTGIGIGSDKLENVFERFTQENKSDTSVNQGSGLGLSIVKAYVGLLGGEIGLESIEGKGSTFHFTLPYKAVKNEMHSSQLNTEETIDVEGNFTNKTILVVEDDVTSYEFLKIVLSDLGIDKIVWAKDGNEVIKQSKENAAIDLVLMDVNLPVMNGYESIKAIKVFRPRLPIIAQTAYALTGDREKSLEAGCDDYITKPIEKEQLLEKIEKFFD